MPHSVLWSPGCIQWCQETLVSLLKMRLWLEIISSPKGWDTHLTLLAKFKIRHDKLLHTKRQKQEMSVMPCHNACQYIQLKPWNPNPNPWWSFNSLNQMWSSSHRRSSTSATTPSPMMRMFSPSLTPSCRSAGSEGQRRRSSGSTHLVQCRSVLVSGRAWADGWLSWRCISSCRG